MKTDSEEYLKALAEATRNALGAPRCQHLTKVSHSRFDEHLQAVCKEVAGRCPDLAGDAGVAAMMVTQRCGLVVKNRTTEAAPAGAAVAEAPPIEETPKKARRAVPVEA